MPPLSRDQDQISRIIPEAAGPRIIKPFAQELPLKRRLSLTLGLLGLVALASILASCDYQPRKKKVLEADIYGGPLPSAPGRPAAPRVAVTSSEASAPVAEITPELQKRREIILANFLKLIETSSTNPGGRNFAIATENLNDLFGQGYKPADFAYAPASRDFLLRKVFDLTGGQDPEPIVKSFCSEKFTIRDARHIEDCMLYRLVANRVAGEGDDLTRVRRIFDWVIRNVELIPAESLAGPSFRQAEARPADVLFRGMATEGPNRWSERGWVFMALCRQIGIDVGLLTYTPRPSLMATPTAAPRPSVSWICAAIVDKKAYLFEQRIGIEVPGPDGTGVATLEEAMTIPEVLARLEVPSLSTYGTSSADLLGSATKVGVLIDSSTGYLAPRMRLLQGQLRGEYRTVLFRDALEQGANFKAAMGARMGLVTLWDLPLRIEEGLFGDSKFVFATQMALQFFDSKYPLLYARTAQLRGDLVEATNKYVGLRFAEKGVQNDKEKTPIPADVQRALDFYSTYFLAQCHMDRGNVDQAEVLYKQLIKMCPEPGPGRNFFYMLRWGAVSNLARIAEAKGDRAQALAFYLHRNLTSDQHGHLIKARQMAWDHPFDEPVPPLPPAPPIPVSEQMKPEPKVDEPVKPVPVVDPK